MNIQSPRSPHEKTGGICYFPRMIDKIRLHQAGTLPEDLRANLGIGFDERCVNFLHVKYSSLVERVKQGGSDLDILDWAYAQGRKPDVEDIEIWNDFMRKRGWNDEVSPRLKQRLEEGGFKDRTDIQTIFDYIDLDEGRDPRAAK